MRVAKLGDGLLEVNGRVVDILVLLLPLLHELAPALVPSVSVRRVVAEQIEILIPSWTEV